MRELRDNWFVLYSHEPLTVPLMCANKTYSELHLKAGASKFHLRAGCTADLPRHRLLSDWSVLLPQDYVQFDMEWNPQSFLPDVQKYVGPEFQQLTQYGQSKVPLSNLQTIMATMDNRPASWFHNLHFASNAVAIVTACIIIAATLYKCCRDRAMLKRLRRDRRIEDAVRTAINGTPRMLGAQTPMPMYTMGHVQSPPLSIQYLPQSYPPSSNPISRTNSQTNLTVMASDFSQQPQIPSQMPSQIPTQHHVPPQPPSAPSVSFNANSGVTLPGYTSTPMVV